MDRRILESRSIEILNAEGWECERSRPTVIWYFDTKTHRQKPITKHVDFFGKQTAEGRKGKGIYDIIALQGPRVRFISVTSTSGDRQKETLRRHKRDIEQYGDQDRVQEIWYWAQEKKGRPWSLMVLTYSNSKWIPLDPQPTPK